VRIKDTENYKNALAALSRLESAGAAQFDLRAIAIFLLYSKDAEVPERLFPFVGDATDPRDRAVVESYEAAWIDFLSGNDG